MSLSHTHTVNPAILLPRSDSQRCGTETSNLFGIFSLLLIFQHVSFLRCGCGILSKQRCYLCWLICMQERLMCSLSVKGNPVSFHRRFVCPVFLSSIFTLCISTYLQTVSRETSRKAPFGTVGCPHCSTAEQLVSLGSRHYCFKWQESTVSNHLYLQWNQTTNFSNAFYISLHRWGVIFKTINAIYAVLHANDCLCESALPTLVLYGCPIALKVWHNE